MIVRLTVSYRGTAYAGWQRQTNALAVQQVVEEALADLLGAGVTLHGAGRTDAGVHARAQAAHLELPRPFPLRGLVHATNHRLPEDVRVTAAHRMPAGFHARKHAAGKEYSYRLVRAAVASPLDAPFSLAVSPRLDVAAMRRAAAALPGPPRFHRLRPRRRRPPPALAPHRVGGLRRDPRRGGRRRHLPHRRRRLPARHGALAGRHVARGGRRAPYAGVLRRPPRRPPAGRRRAHRAAAGTGAGAGPLPAPVVARGRVAAGRGMTAARRRGRAVATPAATPVATPWLWYLSPVLRPPEVRGTGRTAGRTAGRTPPTRR